MDIDSLIASPTLEGIKKCKKQELLKICTKLSIAHSSASTCKQLQRDIVKYFVDEGELEDGELSVFEESESDSSDKATQRKHELEIKRLELEHEAREAERARQFELEKLRLEMANPGARGRSNDFVLGRDANVVPVFDEDDPDSYFQQFEKLATGLGWPKEKWAILLQTKVKGKAQKTLVALHEHWGDYHETLIVFHH